MSSDMLPATRPKQPVRNPLDDNEEAVAEVLADALEGSEPLAGRVPGENEDMLAGEGRHEQAVSGTSTPGRRSCKTSCCLCCVVEAVVHVCL